MSNLDNSRKKGGSDEHIFFFKEELIELFKKFYPHLTTISYKYIAKGDEVKEAIHDLLVKWIEKAPFPMTLSEKDSRATAFVKYATTSTYRMIIDNKSRDKKQGEEKEKYADENLILNVSPDDTRPNIGRAELKLAIKNFKDILERILNKKRYLMITLFAEGKSYEQIRKEMGMKKEAFKKYRLRLSNFLRDHEEIKEYWKSLEDKKLKPIDLKLSKLKEELLE